MGNGHWIKTDFAQNNFLSKFNLVNVLCIIKISNCTTSKLHKFCCCSSYKQIMGDERHAYCKYVTSCLWERSYWNIS